MKNITMQYPHRLSAIAGLILVLLLLSGVFAPTALAGRYVLNQTPQTIQRYFGRPLTQVTHQSNGNSEVTYTYSTGPLRRLLPKFPKQGTFNIDFVNNRAQVIRLEPNASEEEYFNYSQAEAAKLFRYIFGYQPSIWKPIPLPNGGGGHEGFIDFKACLGDGVVNSFSEYRLGLLTSALYYDTLCEPPYKP